MSVSLLYGQEINPFFQKLLHQWCEDGHGMERQLCLEEVLTISVPLLPVGAIAAQQHTTTHFLSGAEVFWGEWWCFLLGDVNGGEV